MRNETSERTSRQWCGRGAVGAGLCCAMLSVACQNSTASEGRGQELRVTTATQAPAPASAPAAPEPGNAPAAAAAPAAAPPASAPSGVAAPSHAKLAAGAAAGSAASSVAVASPAADAPSAKPATGKVTEGAAASSEAFSTWLQAAAPAKAGAPVELEVVLTAKPPYHCNAEYPHKFKLNAAPGLSFPQETVKGMRVTPERSVLSVPVTATSAGKANISGTLSFSVCTEERCLVEKRDLALALDVQ